MNAGNYSLRENPAQVAAMVGLLLFPALAWWVTRHLPAWVNMWALAVSLFFALKLLTLTAGGLMVRASSLGRVFAYLVLWPGMDARAFLAERGSLTSRDNTPVARVPELVFALLKLAGGIAAVVWAARHGSSANASPVLVSWVGMLGIIFTAHFGLLHAISWIWRRAGVNAPPIMRAPIAATSLAEFWSERWNLAFADAARRFLFRPLARRWGARGAGGAVFLVSGLVHEAVISLPARGGWGGPTLYFLIQAGGVAVEKTASARRHGLGRGARGWLWALLVAGLPVPLLFHRPFAGRVILPFVEWIGGLLP